MRPSRKQKRTNTAIITTTVVLVLAAAAALAIFGPFELLPGGRQAAVAQTPVPEPAHSPTPRPTQAPTPTPAPEPTPEAAPLWHFASGTGTGDPLQRSLYEAVLEVDPEQMLLSGRMRLHYLSTAAEPIYSIKLHLHPNSVAQGCMDINSVTINGVEAYWELENGGSVLSVPLVVELNQGQSAALFLDFTIRIPETGNRFGYGKDTIMLGNALPIAAVYENGAWRVDEYVDGLGDSFYSEVADYKVVISAPEEWALASTGSVVEEETVDGVRTSYMLAPQVRDFCLALHEGARVATVERLGVEVMCIAGSTREAEFGANAAADALSFNNELVGSYPYSRLCVVQFDAGGGMEYPGLIMVHNGYFSPSWQSYGEYVIAHEVAHQWWYAVVGSDQLFEPWVDESLTEFMSLEFFRVMRGPEEYQEQVERNRDPLVGYVRTMPVDASLYDFYAATNQEEGLLPYSYVVYYYGAYMYQQLFDELGEAVFYDALRTYYNRHRLKNATGEGLVAAFSEAAGEDLSGWFSRHMAASPLPVIPLPEDGAG